MIAAFVVVFIFIVVLLSPLWLEFARLYLQHVTTSHIVDRVFEFLERLPARAAVLVVAIAAVAVIAIISVRNDQASVASVSVICIAFLAIVIALGWRE